ncbi:MAG TPA: peptide chain release factor N(5)-glutamine methyltransferase [Trichocoleus sp.]|jgi:release factor glutamine methyltransferase
MTAERQQISGFALWQWRSITQKQAIEAGMSPQEVDWLLREVAGLDRLSLRLESFKTQPEVLLSCSLETLAHLWQQRLDARVPVQYLAGIAPWRQFVLRVSPAVLIPRPETEYLIDLALSVVERNPELALGNWADLGTGSGAIAIGLASALPHALLHAVDLSESALSIARENAAANGLSDRIQFYQGSWFEPLTALQGQLSGIVSNPPYIPSQLIPDLQPEVSRHEPHLALDGGADGLDDIRQLVSIAPRYLRSGGVWMIEMMAGQAMQVSQLLQQQGSYREIQIYADFAGLDRFALAYRQ